MLGAQARRRCAPTRPGRQSTIWKGSSTASTQRRCQRRRSTLHFSMSYGVSSASGVGVRRPQAPKRDGARY